MLSPDVVFARLVVIVVVVVVRRAVTSFDIQCLSMLSYRKTRHTRAMIAGYINSPFRNGDTTTAHSYSPRSNERIFVFVYVCVFLRNNLLELYRIVCRRHLLLVPKKTRVRIYLYSYIGNYNEQFIFSTSISYHFYKASKKFFGKTFRQRAVPQSASFGRETSSHFAI